MDTLDEWQEWSNDLADLLPEDAECWPGCNPEGAQESVILDAVRYLVECWEAQPCRFTDDPEWCDSHRRGCTQPTDQEAGR